MIGRNIGAAAATPAAPVPTSMQFYAVFKVCHVDNSCSSLVHECRLQHRRGATMLANKPPGIIWIWARRG